MGKAMIPDINNIDFSSIEIAKPKPRPQFTVLYGAGKVGKTATACYSPDPVILPIGNESGQEMAIKYGIPCFENATGMDNMPFIMGCIARLIRTEHTRKTLIIDNLTRYRESVDDDVEVDYKGKDMKEFGRLQAVSFPYYKKLLSGISMLMKKRDMHVILIAHDVSFNVTMKDGSYYSKTGILAPAGENTNVRAMLESVAHNILYFRNEPVIRKDVKGAMGIKKNIALEGNAKRFIYTKSKGNFFAGSYNELEEFYEIEESESISDLYKDRSNESIKKLWQDLYK